MLEDALEITEKELEIILGLSERKKIKPDLYGLRDGRDMDFELRSLVDAQIEMFSKSMAKIKKEIKETLPYDYERLEVLEAQLKIVQTTLGELRRQKDEMGTFGQLFAPTYGESGLEQGKHLKNYEKARERLAQSRPDTFLFDDEKLMEEYMDMYGTDFSQFANFISQKERLQSDFIGYSMELMNQMFALGNQIFNQQLENIHAEMRAIEDKYDLQYELAEGDKEKQKAIAREKEFYMKKLEKEELKIRQRQAKYQKAQGITNAIINTAVAVSKVAWVPALAAIVAALGAAQVATIIAQPIPKYAEGTDFHPGGLAVVGDGGRSEIIVGKSGMYKTPSTSTLANLEKGSKVYPSERAFRDVIMRQISADVNSNFDYERIENAIEDGFKKAKVNNYVKIPRIAVSLHDARWIEQNAQFN